MQKDKQQMSESLAVQVREELPEIAWIGNDMLREGVVKAWTMSLSKSSFRSIRDIQPAGNPNSMVLTRGDQTDHIRGVTRLATVMADEVIASNPDIAVNRDIVVAGGLCHDIGKAWEFDPENQKRWRQTPRATGLPSLRHSVYGAHICLAAGLPEEVAHIAAAHSGEGELLVRSLEATIVHFADIGYWSIMLAGGVIDPATIAGKYKRPISM
ncbi:MAG TPA: HD domain-containing protein [Tianweitania sediminis]|nr:HD domain-containing protein [Tianweitania sediminis]